MRRQFLDPVGSAPVEEVVRRLGAVQAQVDASAELAIRLRRRRSKPGEVAQALADGRIIRSSGMRGAVHLLTPEEGGAYLALKAEGRQWELPSWQRYYGLAPADWDDFRAAAREALANGPLTPREFGAAITARPKFRHLNFVFAGNWHTLLKPLFWQGVMSFGARREGSPTFQRLDGNPRWRGLPSPDEAGPRVVETYLRAYGPAGIEHLRYWQNAGERKVRSWLAGLGDRVVDVEVGGAPLHMLREDVDELAETSPKSTVRLLPGYDQWVLGPGTADAHIVPPPRRALISRQAHFVIVGGVVSGTWAIRGEHVRITWFVEAGPLPRRALEGEVARVAGILDRQLRPSFADG
jgi:hypothetical protein